MIEANDQVYMMMKTFFEENVPYAKHSGIELLEIADGRGAAQLPDWKETQNHMGSQHAGALFTLAEAASGAAMVSLFADKVSDGPRCNHRPRPFDTRKPLARCRSRHRPAAPSGRRHSR